jgi:hypothetical protein
MAEKSSPIIVVGNKADQNEHFSFIDEKNPPRRRIYKPNLFFANSPQNLETIFPKEIIEENLIFQILRNACAGLCQR